MRSPRPVSMALVVLGKVARRRASGAPMSQVPEMVTRRDFSGGSDGREWWRGREASGEEERDRVLGGGVGRWR